ncbi:MAG: cytosolic protein [Verrucomicrobiales bacterium]
MSIDFDSPWKDFLEQFLPSIMELCFPRIAARIDWSNSFEFLDKELQEVLRDSLRGRQYVDKLVKVALKEGREMRVYLHLEVQHRKDPELEERIFRYHFRLVEKYGPEVASLVILADQDDAWRPSEYSHETLECRVRFEFPTCKLKDLAADLEKLLNSPLPAAVVILADWVAQHTRHDSKERYRWKIRLVRNLYEKGLPRADVVRIFTLADWLLPLPREQNKEFRREVIELEIEKRMPYITSIQQLGREEGRQEGWQEGRVEGEVRRLQISILQTIKKRFRIEDESISALIRGKTDINDLELLFDLALTVNDAESFRKGLR